MAVSSSAVHSRFHYPHQAAITAEYLVLRMKEEVAKNPFAPVGINSQVNVLCYFYDPHRVLQSITGGSFPVKCVELLRKDPRVNWNVRDENGETPIMIALKNKKKEMVKILLKNPKVDRRDHMKTNEGNDILTEMIQEADSPQQWPPPCPVSIVAISSSSAAVFTVSLESKSDAISDS